MSAREAYLDVPEPVWLTARPRVPPVLCAIAAATLLLPEEASFFVGSLRLTVARTIFIVIAPLVVWRGVQRMSGADYRFAWSDLCVLLAAFWIVLSVWQTEGADRAIAGAGAMALDLTVPYLAARFLLRNPGQAVAFCRLLTVLFAVTGLLSVLDTVTGRMFTRDLFASVTGYAKGLNLDTIMRYGLLRASGPFEHPILLGTVCGTGLLLAATQDSSARPWLLCGTGVGLVASISAGPVGGALLGFAMLLYARLTPGFEGRWRLLMSLGGGLFGAFYVLSPHPFGTLISHFTIDQQNSYYRLMVWQIMGEVVLDQPLFGIGIIASSPAGGALSEDSVWLACSTMFGIPGSLLIFLTMAGAMSRRVDTVTTQLSAQDRRLGLVLSIVLTVLIYTGFTVHYWGATWILLGLLAGVRAHLGELGARNFIAK